MVLDKKGVALPDQDRALAGIKGVVIFDGTWAQAKTLWWRNAWVLKAKRLVLNPRGSSLYGQLRREPRREGLSTIEAAALTLATNGAAARNRNNSASKFRANAGALPAGSLARRIERSSRRLEIEKGRRAPKEATKSDLTSLQTQKSAFMFDFKANMKALFYFAGTAFRR